MATPIPLNSIPQPKGCEYVILADPKSGLPMSPFGALGRWVDPAGNSLLVRRVVFNVAASATATSLVAAITDYVIVVISAYLKTAATATNITFNSASTAISPLLANGVNGDIQLNQMPCGFWFATNPSEALTITTGAGSTTGGILQYVLVPSASVLLADGVSSLYGVDGQVINL